MFCPKCGNVIPDNSTFCRYCGNIINGAENAPIQNQQVNTNENVNVNANANLNTNEPDNNKLNPFALTGFIVSLSSLLLSFWGITAIVGIVFSSIAHYQLKDQPKSTSKNFALAGLIIGIVSLALSILWDIIACSCASIF